MIKQTYKQPNDIDAMYGLHPDLRIGKEIKNGY